MTLFPVEPLAVPQEQDFESAKSSALHASPFAPAMDMFMSPPPPPLPSELVETVTFVCVGAVPLKAVPTEWPPRPPPPCPFERASPIGSGLQGDRAEKGDRR